MEVIGWKLFDVFVQKSIIRQVKPTKMRPRNICKCTTKGNIVPLKVVSRARLIYDVLSLE